MRRFLYQSFARFRGLPVPPDDPSWERILERLEEEPEAASESAQRAIDSVRSVRHTRRWQWPAVAAAMVTVAIGVYAYRAQRESAPKAVLPAVQSSAPSVNGAAETPQVAVLTPGSTKPEAAPSREEILRGVAAQIAAAQATDTGAARPKFAVASVRPIPQGDIGPGIWNGFKCLGVDGLWEVGFYIPGTPSPAQGRCTAAGVDLENLVRGAYSSSFEKSANTTRMELPPALANMWVQINAVAENPERATKAELKLMVQTLLEDRFKARVHRETRERDGYVLTIAKSGIKFKETPGPESCREYPDQAGPMPPNTYLKGKCRVERLAGFIKSGLDLPFVFDKTGLAGIYDIDFQLVFAPFGRGGGRGNGGGTAQQYTTPLPKALEDQLGLHLERGKGPLEHVVVDHIEAPSEN